MFSASVQSLKCVRHNVSLPTVLWEFQLLGGSACVLSFFIPNEHISFFWPFPHRLPIISVIYPDLFISCCQGHTRLPHGTLNLIPTAPLSLWIQSSKRPWAGLFSRGELLERKKGWQRGCLRSVSGNTASQRAIPHQGCICTQHTTAGMSSGVKQAGLPTETDGGGGASLTLAAELVLSLHNVVKRYHCQLMMSSRG